MCASSFPHWSFYRTRSLDTYAVETGRILLLCHLSLDEFWTLRFIGQHLGKVLNTDRIGQHDGEGETGLLKSSGPVRHMPGTLGSLGSFGCLHAS